MANENWYYSKQGQQLGPITFEALTALAQSGQLHPDDLVWTDGMANWTPARATQGLFPTGAAAPGAGMYAPPGYGPVPGAVAPGMMNYYGTPYQPTYAGFWLRFCAAVVDGILLWVVQLLIQVPFVGIEAALGIRDPQQQPTPQEVVLSLVFALLSLVMQWLYYALMESSKHQATLGKMAVGIKVTDLSGARISFPRATGRFFAEILSTLTCFIGYIMAAFTEKKQGLHDMIASTLVVKK